MFSCNIIHGGEVLWILNDRVDPMKAQVKTKKIPKTSNKTQKINPGAQLTQMDRPTAVNEMKLCLQIHPGTLCGVCITI